MRRASRVERMISCALMAAVFAIAASLLVSGGSGSALAQTADELDRRLDKVESEMRAVQRKVFPGGNNRYFEPEFAPPQENASAPAGVQTPQNQSITTLIQRMDSLEQQVSTLTGALEQSNFRIQALEEQLTGFKGDAEYRLGVLEGNGGGAAPALSPGATPTPPAAQAAPTQSPAASGPAASGPAASGPAASGPAAAAAAEGTADTNDATETQYRSAYSFVISRDYDRAVPALKTFIQQHPKSGRASHAQYWMGRVFMNQKRYNEAALAFLEGYQDYPKGDRAAESLLWLGEALIARGEPQDACRAFNELGVVYPDEAKGRLREKLRESQAKAACS